MHDISDTHCVKWLGPSVAPGTGLHAQPE